jgi:hypothetical protein
MVFAAGALMLVGGLIVLFGTVMFVVTAFRTSVAWGIGALLFAPVALVFLVRKWDESKKGLLVTLTGVGLMAVGALLGMKAGLGR